MKNLPIGVFDSGIGGLTVAHALKEKLPNESIVYFGDTEHLPYGEKSDEAIKNFSKKIAKFLIDKDCKAIVMACNSASSVAFNVVKQQAYHIPVFNVIDPIVEVVANNCNNCKIGVIGTKTTIKSGVYRQKIQNICSAAEVVSLATPLLVPMIEEGFINEKISHQIIGNYLSNQMLANLDFLILACTHYPLIHQEISAFYNHKVDVIDSVSIVADSILSALENKGLLNTIKTPEYQFYVSNFTNSFSESAKFFFKEEIKIEQVNIWN